MKRLYILRHAQASAAHSGADKDRPLSPEGLEEAKALGKAMARKNYKPDLIYCSNARRTAQTCETVTNVFEYPPKTQMMSAFYEASRGDLFAAIQAAPDETNALMLIGHNPAIYALAAMLGAHGDERALSILSQGYAPATLSVLDVPADTWAEIDPDECILKDVLISMDYNAPERPTRWM